MGTAAVNPTGVTFDAPLQQGTAVSVPAGVSFDAPLSQPQAVSVPQQRPSQGMPSSQQSYTPSAKVSAAPGSMPSDSWSQKLSLWSQNVASDLRHGTDITGVGKVMKAMGAHGFNAGVSPETADFMGSLPLGLLRATKGGAELTQPGQRWQGTKDFAGGALDAATVPGSFVAPEAGELAGAGTDAALTQAGKVAGAVKNAVSVKALQPKVQGAISSVMADLAAEHGLSIPEGTNVRDAAQAVSSGVRAKAQKLYQSLDDALGGTRFQSFGEAIENVQRAIRDEVGLDPVRDKQLQHRLADAKAARDAAMDQLRANGVDPSTIQQADSLHQQAMALQDVSRAVRSSTDVHPSQMADGADAVSSTQVRMKPLFNRMQQLATPNPKYPGTPSRLVQALGEDRAAQILHDVDAAHLAAQKIAARNQWIKRGATAVGLYGLGHEVFTGLHSWLGEQQ